MNAGAATGSHLVEAVTHCLMSGQQTSVAVQSAAAAQNLPGFTGVRHACGVAWGNPKKRREMERQQVFSNERFLTLGRVIT
jgi:hypothetical protein